MCLSLSGKESTYFSYMCFFFNIQLLMTYIISYVNVCIYTFLYTIANTEYIARNFMFSDEIICLHHQINYLSCLEASTCGVDSSKNLLLKKPIRPEKLTRLWKHYQMFVQIMIPEVRWGLNRGWGMKFWYQIDISKRVCVEHPRIV